MSSTHSFTRNASCPTQGTLVSQTNKKTSSSTHALHLSAEQQPPTTDSPHVTPKSTTTTTSGSSNIFQRIRNSLVKFFKPISPEEDSQSMNIEQSTFIYDPEVDLREEHLSLLSKRLLSTLRESKIKHLSCDHLFLPCNHLRNIARQCLIMSAEEPFGIMGVQIRIKLTLSDHQQTIKYLPTIQINPKQKTTFEIEIELHEDTKVLTLRRMLPEMKMFRDLKEKSALYVSPRCLLVKIVFYKTAEPKRALVDT